MKKRKPMARKPRELISCGYEKAVAKQLWSDAPPEAWLAGGSFDAEYARRLAKWLIAFADWAESRERKGKARE